MVHAQEQQQVASIIAVHNLRGPSGSEDFDRENDNANTRILNSGRKHRNNDNQNKGNVNPAPDENKLRKSENDIRKEVNQKLRDQAAAAAAKRKKKQKVKQNEQMQTKTQLTKKEKKDEDKTKKEKQKDKKKNKADDNDEDGKKKPNKQSAKLPTKPNNAGKKDQTNSSGKNNDGNGKNDNKKPSKKDDNGTSGKVQQNDSKNQGSINGKPSKKDDATSPTTIVQNSGSPPPPPSPQQNHQQISIGGQDKWRFVKALVESSTLLDSFEDGGNDSTGFDLLEWTSTSRNPWKSSSTYSHDGKSSMVSGITSHTYEIGGSQPVYSNLTLTTESNFNGGVITFRLLAKSLTLPTESFFVTVDGDVELPPEELSSSSTWVEYSVPVERGVHKITWVHVYNPYGFKTLPAAGGDYDVGLWMDDLRLVPFTSLTNLNPFELINGGDGNKKGVSSWEVSKDGSSIAASSSDMQGSVGTAEIQFALYSKKGAMLTYRVQTSTSGPHDDFAIHFNKNNNAVDVATSMFGDMIGYESRSLSIPKGKVVVTLSHRKNPGRFDRTLLQSLGEVGTEGKTWLESLSLNLN